MPIWSHWKQFPNETSQNGDGAKSLFVQTYPLLLMGTFLMLFISLKSFQFKNVKFQVRDKWPFLVVLKISKKPKFWLFWQSGFLNKLLKHGGPHSSVDPSPPTILSPWVHIPCTTSTLYSLQIWMQDLQDWPFSVHGK